MAALVCRMPWRHLLTNGSFWLTSHTSSASLLVSTSQRHGNQLSFVHSSSSTLASDSVTKETVRVIFVDKDGTTRHEVQGCVGDHLLKVAHENNIEMEGACEASLACTTCHVYVLNDFNSKLPPSSETEDDLLDMAPFLRENSRLGCQIILTKELDGMVVQLPTITRNFYVDGHKPAPH